MTKLMRPVPLVPFTAPPVHRARLARYLEVPSVAQIDTITDDEIRKLDERRCELLSPWQFAVAVPIQRISGSWIEVAGNGRPIQTSARYARHLLDSGADSLVVAALSLGAVVDEHIREHLSREEVYEAFVLKQWAATMTEQARVHLTRSLRRWTRENGQSLQPFDGPGYNGWPLHALHPLLEMIDQVEFEPPRPMHANEFGVLWPTNSMVIVHGLSGQRDALVHEDERVAQCHRCSMQGCRYRVAPPAVRSGAMVGVD